MDQGAEFGFSAKGKVVEDKFGKKIPTQELNLGPSAKP